MSEAVIFTVPGEPCAKRRPRAGKAFGSGRTVLRDPAENKAEAEVLGIRAMYAFREVGPFDGPVSVHIVATWPVRMSWPKKRQRETLGAAHVQKPDADNVAKWVLDGLNRIAWADDAQVAALSIEKRWGVSPLTTVTVSPIAKNTTEAEG